MTPTDLPSSVSAAAAAVFVAASELAITDRLAGAEARHAALLDEIDLEAARLRALVATERASLARLRRKG